MPGTLLQLRGGSAVEADAYTGTARELVVDTTNWRLRLCDGSTMGARPVAMLADFAGRTPVWSGAAGGTAQARTIAPSPAIAAYAAGQRFVFIVSAANTATNPTLAVNGLAALTVRNAQGNPIWPGQLRGVCEVLHDGTAWRLLAPDAAGLQVDAGGSGNASTGAPTAVTWANPGAGDSIGAWASGAPTRLTAGATGRWRGVAGFTWGSNATGARIISIRRNGNILVQDQTPAMGSVVQTIAFETEMVAGEYLEVFGFQDSGVTISMLNATVWLSVAR